MDILTLYPTMGYDINILVKMAVNARASDIHLHAGDSPAMRVDGNIVHIEGSKLTADDTERIAHAITPKNLLDSLAINKDADFSMTFPELHLSMRFRTNVFFAKGCYSIVIRLVYENMLTIDTVGFPSVDVIKNLLVSPRGLIIVTGPTGSGKSTTLAAMVSWLNKTQEKHIITIEDPIEYIHNHERCLISQRELMSDTPSFKRAIIGALRQDPDILLVGEMRDLDTVEATVSAAETGHLVFSTLHTTGSSRTVDRIIDVFPEGSKELVRTQLASNLVAVISQVLCKKKDGIGRVPAFEIMVRTDSVSNLIREGKTFRIASELEVGSAYGMIPLDRHLYDLCMAGVIAQEEAISKAQAPKELAARLGMDLKSSSAKKKGIFSF